MRKKEEKNMQNIKTVEEFEKSKVQKQERHQASGVRHQATSQEPQTKSHKLNQPNQKNQLDSTALFKKLGINDQILRAIAERGFTKPTSIQKRSVPLVLAGKDVIAQAATGSGKTLAFGSGIIQNTSKGKGLQALILTPTRELAEQNAKEMRKFSKYRPLRIVTVYGGVPINPQIHAVKTADVVVGTPGRLLDHMQRRTIFLNMINILVLDEADRMLDMGFLPDVEKIINACPKERQTLLFSATVSGGVARLAKKYMKNPKEVYVESYIDPAKLEQVYYDVQNNMKFSLLVYLLKKEKSKLVMIFCNTRRYIDIVAENLKKQGINATPIHGGFAQSKRQKSLGKFHSQESQVLVCTDVAARGLDIPHISHIYNYDIPKESIQYIHRIGRTARAGKEGKVINILSGNDHENFRRVMSENSGKIKRAERPYIKMIRMERPAKKRGRPGGRGGPRRKYHKPAGKKQYSKPARRS